MKKMSENSDKSFGGPSNEMEIEGVGKIVVGLNTSQKNHRFCLGSRSEHKRLYKAILECRRIHG